MNVRVRIILFLLLLISTSVFSQRWKRFRYEVFVATGPSILNGDLGGANRPGRHFLSDIDILSTRYFFSLGGRYKIREKFSFKLNFIFGRLYSSDTFTEYEPRAIRNVTSKTFFFEPSIHFEYSIIKERIGIRYTLQYLNRFKIRYVNTYVLIGIGGLTFNPRTENKDFFTNRNENFLKFQGVLPLGIGFKYGINRLTTLSIEFIQRYTTTDYIDGFSDKYSKARDSYFTVNILVSRRLKTARSGLPML